MSIPKVGRIPALQVCLERGWGNGTCLVSRAWKIPRKLLGQQVLDDPVVRARRAKHWKEIPHQAVRVALVKENGELLREEFLYTFPDDVQDLGMA